MPWFCSITAMLAVTFLMPHRAIFPAEDHYKVREIKPNVFVWLAEDILEQEGDPEYSRASNAGFVITEDSVVVVNTTNTPFNGRALLYEIRRHTDLPVKFVVNTGASPGETLGNEVFEDFQPTILSTPAADMAMRHYQQELTDRVDADWRLQASMRGIHPTPANKTFDRETLLETAGQQVKVIPLGANASPGNAAVYLPQAKVVFLGSVFENEFIPRIGAGDIRHWIETLRQVETWDADVYVPEHGEPGGKQQVRQFRNFLEWLSSQVESSIRKGKTLQQIQDELVPFQRYHWRAPELQSKAVAAVYRQLAQAGEASAATKQSSP